MPYDRWDVLTARFPFTDMALSKPRPVVVLSNNSFNRSHEHIVCCMVTTATRSKWPTDHELVDLEACGLAHASLVRWKVFTLPVSVFSKRIGALGDLDRSAVAARLGQVMLA
jgi:mRNA interferase MazF